VIDSEGFRSSVGIVLSNREGRLFWAKRIGQNSWQFPQGGIHSNESPRDALYRELYEETGLEAGHVEIIGSTRRWLRYRLPKHLIRRRSSPLCIGQKQRWFLLRMLGDDGCVCLDTTERPEFDNWRWVEFWRPQREVVFFKRGVYKRALRELGPLLFPEGLPPRD
jgi:putative (di)nucleoside polyphosphate hydrolase